jgi:hypothetical protein
MQPHVEHEGERHADTSPRSGADLDHIATPEGSTDKGGKALADSAR